MADADVIDAFNRAIKDTRASDLEQLSLYEAGVVESGLQNLSYGDADSLGALQERVSIYGRAHALDPYQSAVRFLKGVQARVAAGFSGTAGQLAQAEQRSAFPARYDQAEAQARGYLTGTTTGSPAAPTSAAGASGSAVASADGGGFLSPLFDAATKALVWTVLLLGGAALVAIGGTRIAQAGGAQTA